MYINVNRLIIYNMFVCISILYISLYVFKIENKCIYVYIYQ